MNERALVSILALLALLSLFVAPWAAISRETGARGTVIVLPDRTYDFTGRTDPVEIPGQAVVLGVGALALLGIAAAGALGQRRRTLRYTLWLLAGAVLVGTVVWGTLNVSRATQNAQYATLLSDAQDELADPGRRVDVEVLQGFSMKA